MAASAPAPVVIASAPAASAPSAPGSGAVSCGGGAACGGGGGAGGSSGGGSASASPAPAAPAAPEEPSADPSQPSDPTDSEDEDNEDKPDSTDPGSEDASLTLLEDSAATPAAASVPARARLFSLPVKMLGATAATDTPATWVYGWNSEDKCVTLNSEDVIYGEDPVSVTTSGGTYSIDPDGNGNYTNTVFTLDAMPKYIQAVDATGTVKNINNHISIKLIAGSGSNLVSNTAKTDFKGIDTVHVAANPDDGSVMRLRMSTDVFLNAEGKSLYMTGGQLWLDGAGLSSSDGLNIKATLYLGGGGYVTDASKGLDSDVRAEGRVYFKNTINLIDNASIVGVITKTLSESISSSGYSEEVVFTSSCKVNGQGFDLALKGANLLELSKYKNSPFIFSAGSELKEVRSLIIGGIYNESKTNKYGATTLNIEGAASEDQPSVNIEAGSLRVGQGSAVNVAEGASHMYFSGRGSAADYDAKAGMGDYSLLLLKDSASENSAVINLADKASLSCNTNSLTHTDGTVIGRVTGAFAVDVASDGTLSISGGTAAGKETVGKAGDTCSIMENLKLDIKAGASLVLNDIILGDRHALKGEDAANPGSLKLNNVVIGLVPNNYTTQSIANLAEGGSLELKATGGGARTLTIDDEASILTVYYTGMENLEFVDGSTLVLDFANMELELGEHKYVKVVFDDSVKFDPEKVTITSVSGSLDNTGYYLPTVEGGATNVVYFLAPEPASAVLCLFGLAAGAARRRRKQK